MGLNLASFSLSRRFMAEGSISPPSFDKKETKHPKKKSTPNPPTRPLFFPRHADVCFESG